MIAQAENKTNFENNAFPKILKFDVPDFTKGHSALQLCSISHLRQQRDHGEQEEEPDKLHQLDRLLHLIRGRQGMDLSSKFISF